MAASLTPCEARRLALVASIGPFLLPRRARLSAAAASAAVFAYAWAGARAKYDAARDQLTEALTIATNAVQLAEQGRDHDDHQLSVLRHVNAGHTALARFSGDMIRLAGDAVRELPDQQRGVFEQRLTDALAKLTEHHPGEIT